MGAFSIGRSIIIQTCHGRLKAQEEATLREEKEARERAQAMAAKAAEEAQKVATAQKQAEVTPSHEHMNISKLMF